MAMRKYECPACKYRFKADADQMLEGGAISLVRGNTAPRENPADRCVDLTCPNCHNEFEIIVEA